MRVVRCELLRLRVPFRWRFGHARADRSYSDGILVRLEDAGGAEGFGEIQARTYVTGEHNDAIFAVGGPALAAEIVGQTFETRELVLRSLQALLADQRWGPALYGGFEGALLNLWAQRNDLDYASLLGARRRSPAGRCLTLGFETPLEALSDGARRARVSGATAVKLKVGGPDDAVRVRALKASLGQGIDLRLDANGTLSPDAAHHLLRECGGSRVVGSLEQPFAVSAPDLEANLRHLHRRTGVPLMADESVCGVADAERWAASGAYQLFNVRVGKCGGLLGSAAVMAVARRHGIGMVAGTMVGETGVLSHASEMLLEHSGDLPYVEGLGQSRTLLTEDPVERRALGAGRVHFRLREGAGERCVVEREEFVSAGQPTSLHKELR